ncbi:MAG: hypothetical protein WKF45_01200 [Ilumatobacteraceae bacterium]
MLERDTLEILASEMPCVDDDWRLAGTLDHLARLGRSLRFAMLGGEVVEIPAGTVVVLDKKAGRRRLASNGAVQYWQGYAVQVAAYARSQQYDTDTGERGEWPWPISQDHALIAHLDGDTALEGGTPTCSLVYVDLVAGRRAGELCCLAKAWDALNSSKSSTFSIAQIAAAPEGSVATVESGDSSVAPSSPAEPPPFGEPAVPVAPPHVEPQPPASAGSGAGGTLRADGQRATQQHRAASGAAAAARPVEPPPFGEPTTPPGPNEGGDADFGAVSALSAQIRALDQADLDRIDRTVAEANGGRVVLVHARHGARCVVTRSPAGCCTGRGRLDDRHHARHAAAALDDDSLSQPAAALGAVVGQLDATSAAVWADIAAAVAREDLTVDPRPASSSPHQIAPSRRREPQPIATGGTQHGHPHRNRQ